jgi:hypothetical protein
MKTLLVGGLNFIVDDDVWIWAKNFPWFRTKHRAGYYAARCVYINGKKKVIYLHREIMGEPGGNIDHINGNTLDNRRQSLRKATTSQNIFAGNWIPGKTGFRGVWKNCSGYCAVIKHEGRRYYCGQFKTPELAFEAWNKKAMELFGEFASPRKCWNRLSTSSPTPLPGLVTAGRRLPSVDPARPKL